MMNDSLGKFHFLLTFVFLNGTFFPMHFLSRMPQTNRRSLRLRRLERPVTAESIHDDLRVWDGGQPDSVCAEFFWQHVFGHTGGSAIPGIPIRWNGPLPAHQAMEILPSNRSSVGDPMNTVILMLTKIFCPSLNRSGQLRMNRSGRMLT